MNKNKELIQKTKIKDIPLSQNRSNNKILSCFQTLLLLYTIMMTVPSLFINGNGRIGGIDFSWPIGLCKAVKDGLVFGKDVLFTFGPLGFLDTPIFVYKSLWIYSATYILVIYLLLISACLMYIKKMKADLEGTVIFAIIFIAVLKVNSGCNFELIFSIFIFSYLYIIEGQKIILLLLLAFLYGILPFTKFSSVAGGCIIGIAFLSILIQGKRFKEAYIFLIVCIISFFVAGTILIGTPKAIVTYLYGCWQISSGYNSAMGIDGGNIDLFFALFSWIMYIGLLCYCIFKKNKYSSIFLILSFGILSLGFKLGFVRQDDHSLHFYSMCVLVFGLFYLNHHINSKIVKYSLLLFVFIMLYQCGTESLSSPNQYLRNSFTKKIQNIHFCLDLLKDTGDLEEINKSQLSHYYHLKSGTVQTITGHMMDVFPYDIAVAEAYKFKWNPRPVFQSYSAYTEYLDSLNAKHFSSDSAPEYILYALGTIDNRYAIFDEPATFRTLLQKYRPVMQDGKFIILQKNSFANDRIEEHISTEYGKFGQTIPLPKCEDGLLFAKIRIEHNLAGLGRKFLYKSPNVYLTFFNDEKIISREPKRFVFSNAMNGVFLSQYIENINNLLDLWNGNIQQNITGIQFQTKHPEFFKNKITVEFFKMSKEITENSTGYR